MKNAEIYERDYQRHFRCVKSMGLFAEGQSYYLERRPAEHLWAALSDNVPDVKWRWQKMSDEEFDECFRPIWKSLSDRASFEGSDYASRDCAGNPANDFRNGAEWAETHAWVDPEVQLPDFLPEKKFSDEVLIRDPLGAVRLSRRYVFRNGEMRKFPTDGYGFRTFPGFGAVVAWLQVPPFDERNFRDD